MGHNDGDDNGDDGDDGDGNVAEGVGEGKTMYMITVTLTVTPSKMLSSMMELFREVGTEEVHKTRASY